MSSKGEPAPEAAFGFPASFEGVPRKGLKKLIGLYLFSADLLFLGRVAEADGLSNLTHQPRPGFQFQKAVSHLSPDIDIEPIRSRNELSTIHSQRLFAALSTHSRSFNSENQNNPKHAHTLNYTVTSPFQVSGRIVQSPNKQLRTVSKD